MDQELKRLLRQQMNQSALVNGVPSAENFDNTTDSLEKISDNLGQDSATPDYTFDATATAIALIKGVLGVNVLEEGTLTTSSATVPADTTIGAAYGNDYFNGCFLIPITGSAAFQIRKIVDFATTTGVFTIDAQQPFTAATGTVAYVIVRGDPTLLVPAADATTNTTVSHAVGSKSDTIPAMDQAPSANDSIMRHVKAILERLGATPADPDDSVLTILGQRDTAADTGVTTGAETLVGLLRQVVTCIYRLTETAISDTTDPVDMTTEVADNTVFANILTKEGDTSDYDRRVHSLEAVSLKISDLPQTILHASYSTGSLANADTATVMALDAIAGTCRDVRIKIAISGATAGAGITPTWYVSDASDQTTLDRVDPDARSQHNLAGARTELYEFGDLDEGGQLQFRIASAGNDSGLTYVCSTTYEQ